MNPKISETHRKELLQFLLLKTAAVRSGLKPGELLRVRHCYKARNTEGFQFCLYRKDILEIMKLDHIELRQEAGSSLVLFYHRPALARTLEVPENLELLRRLGYPVEGTCADCMERLKDRFSDAGIPHEVGVFIGYPAKDVLGFIRNLPRTPVHRGRWQVFGDAAESISKMRLYRRVELIAGSALDVCGDLQTFFERMTNLNINIKDRSMASE